MKTSKYLISIFVTYLALGLVGILSADVADNNIAKYPPVYDVSNMDQTAIRQVDAFNRSSNVARVGVNLDKPANVTPALPNTYERTFLGYSDENSNLQLYIKPLTFLNLLWGGGNRSFGAPIPLKPGSYTIDVVDKDLGNLRVKLTVKLEDTEVKTSSSWFTSGYEKASVYLITITKL